MCQELMRGQSVNQRGERSGPGAKCKELRASGRDVARMGPLPLFCQVKKPVCWLSWPPVVLLVVRPYVGHVDR